MAQSKLFWSKIKCVLLNCDYLAVSIVPMIPPSKTNQILTPTDTMLVSALKELVAGLYREQNKVQNLLSSLGFALRNFKNIDQVLELAPLMAARVTEADCAALLLFTKQGQIKLEHFYDHNFAQAAKIRETIEQVINQVNQDKIETTEKTTLVDGLLKQRLGSRARSYSTPILIDNTQRGRIYIFSRDANYIWTQTRRKLLHLIADQTAVAIANHDLTMDLRSRVRQDKEMEIASEIQKRLLPPHCPTIKGLKIAARCRTADRVGGDYYDFIPTDYDRHSQEESEANPKVHWSIVIGDVMGKGLSAGLIMTMTRGMLRAEVLNRHSPAKVLQHLNQVMYVDLETAHRFVTLFYSEYDPISRILRFSNAAHNPPLLWHAQTQKILHLDSPGVVIGLEPNSLYQEAQIKLEKGDTLLYYTDGITEAANQHGDRFEEDNLIKVLESVCKNETASQDIIDNLFEQIDNFTGMVNQNTDDMTVVIVQAE